MEAKHWLIGAAVVLAGYGLLQRDAEGGGATSEAEVEESGNPGDAVPPDHTTSQPVGVIYSASYSDDEGGDEPESEFDEDAARRDAEQEAADDGYHGWCSSDCSGHEAGYQWAHAKGLDSPRNTYDSPSFDEGQRAYTDKVTELLEQKRSDFEDDPSSSDYAE